MVWASALQTNLCTFWCFLGCLTFWWVVSFARVGSHTKVVGFQAISYRTVYIYIYIYTYIWSWCIIIHIQYIYIYTPSLSSVNSSSLSLRNQHVVLGQRGTTYAESYSQLPRQPLNGKMDNQPSDPHGIIHVTQPLGKLTQLIQILGWHTLSHTQLARQKCAHSAFRNWEMNGLFMHKITVGHDEVTTLK